MNDFCRCVRQETLASLLRFAPRYALRPFSHLTYLKQYHIEPPAVSVSISSVDAKHNGRMPRSCAPRYKCQKSCAGCPTPSRWTSSVSNATLSFAKTAGSPVSRCFRAAPAYSPGQCRHTCTHNSSSSIMIIANSSHYCICPDAIGRLGIIISSRRKLTGG